MLSAAWIVSTEAWILEILDTKMTLWFFICIHKKFNTISLKANKSFLKHEISWWILIEYKEMKMRTFSEQRRMNGRATFTSAKNSDWKIAELACGYIPVKKLSQSQRYGKNKYKTKEEGCNDVCSNFSSRTLLLFYCSEWVEDQYSVIKAEIWLFYGVVRSSRISYKQTMQYHSS